MTNKAELETQLQESDPTWWARLPQIHAENAYVCQQQDCRRYVITRDVDRGVTPMLISCRTKDGVLTGCKGPMASMGYPPTKDKPQHLGPATLEWYRPEASPLGFFDSNAELEEHIRRGGLVLRPIQKDTGHDKQQQS